ncbi:MAG: WD40 repeat domain-containing protein, partial [Candidatus Omnitrophica bacterium]|nr:WD40 repeat domain-containing protein [Candidatus Omnitrophota bacterium]
MKANPTVTPRFPARYLKEFFKEASPRAISSLLLLTCTLTWTVPSFALRQTGLEEDSTGRRQDELKLALSGNPDRDAARVAGAAAGILKPFFRPPQPAAAGPADAPVAGGLEETKEVGFKNLLLVNLDSGVSRQVTQSAHDALAGAKNKDLRVTTALTLEAARGAIFSGSERAERFPIDAVLIVGLADQLEGLGDFLEAIHLPTALLSSPVSSVPLATTIRDLQQAGRLRAVASADFSDPAAVGSLVAPLISQLSRSGLEEGPFSDQQAKAAILRHKAEGIESVVFVEDGITSAPILLRNLDGGRIEDWLGRVGAPSSLEDDNEPTFYIHRDPSQSKIKVSPAAAGPATGATAGGLEEGLRTLAVLASQEVMLSVKSLADTWLREAKRDGRLAFGLPMLELDDLEKAKPWLQGSPSPGLGLLVVADPTHPEFVDLLLETKTPSVLLLAPELEQEAVGKISAKNTGSLLATRKANLAKPDQLSARDVTSLLDVLHQKMAPSPAGRTAGLEEIPEIGELAIAGQPPQLSSEYSLHIPLDGQNPEAALFGFLARDPQGGGVSLRYVVRVTRSPDSSIFQMAVLSLQEGHFTGPASVEPGQRITILAPWKEHWIVNPATGTDLPFTNKLSLHVATGANYGGMPGIFVVLSRPANQQGFPELALLPLRAAGVEEERVELQFGKSRSIQVSGHRVVLEAEDKPRWTDEGGRIRGGRLLFIHDLEGAVVILLNSFLEKKPDHPKWIREVLTDVLGRVQSGRFPFVPTEGNQALLLSQETVKGLLRNSDSSQLTADSVRQRAVTLKILGRDSGQIVFTIAQREVREVARLEGHQGRVRSLAFAPDGTLVSAADREIFFWDLFANAPASSPITVRERLTQIAVDPQEGTVASVSPDRRPIDLWSYGHKREHLMGFHGHGDIVLSVAFSPYGKLLASGSADRTVRIWDVSSGELLRILQGHGEWVRSVTFSPKGDLLASADGGGTVSLWNTSDWQRLAAIKAHPGRISSVAFSPDGQWIASAGDGRRDYTVKVWDIQGRRLHTFSDYTAGVTSVAFHPAHPRLLVSGDRNSSLRFWDAASGDFLSEVSMGGDSTPEVHPGESQIQMAFSPDGKTLASAGNDRSIRLWDISGLLARLEQTSSAGSPSAQLTAGLEAGRNPKDIRILYVDADMISGPFMSYWLADSLAGTGVTQDQIEAITPDLERVRTWVEQNRDSGKQSIIITDKDDFPEEKDEGGFKLLEAVKTADPVARVIFYISTRLIAESQRRQIYRLLAEGVLNGLVEKPTDREATLLSGVVRQQVKNL